MEGGGPEEKALECLSTHIALKLQEGTSPGPPVPIPEDSPLKRALVAHNVVPESKHALDFETQQTACLVLGEFVQAANEHASKNAGAKKKNNTRPRSS